METGGIGVYAQGAEATLTMVPPLDETGSTIIGVPNVPSGPLAPGAGVLGRGGVPIPPAQGPVAAGVIGLAGGLPIPDVFETGDTGVYGAGPTGVFGHGPIGVRGQGDTGVRGQGGGNGSGVHGVSLDAGRGGVFESARSAQVQLIPQVVRASFPNSVPVTPQEIPVKRGEGVVSLPKDGRGGDLLALTDDQGQCTLWFCVRGEGAGPAQWAQVLLGTSVVGRG
jgi:hypothetical protein